MRRIEYIQKLLGLPRYISPEASRRFEQALLEACKPYDPDTACSSKAQLVIYSGPDRIIIRFPNGLAPELEVEAEPVKDRVQKWLEEEI